MGRRHGGRRSCQLILIAAAAAVTVAIAPAAAAQSAKTISKRVEAIRLDVVADRTTYASDKDPDLTVRLLDPKGGPIKAPKDLDVALTATALAGGKPYSFRLRIKRGESSAKIELEMRPKPSPGGVQIRAVHPELLEGGTVIYITAKKSTPAKPIIKGSPPTEDESARAAPAQDGDPVLQRSRLALPVRIQRVALRWQEEPCAPTMIVTPTRPLKADGNDWAEVTIVEPVVQNTRFFVSTTLGTLSSDFVDIRAGEAVGKVRITSDTVGNATVRCVKAVPALSTEGADPPTVRFRPPVTNFELAVTPPRVPWVDRARIVVTLTRAPGTPVATDEPRSVSLQREHGSGEIHPEAIKIDAGEFEARATFTPYGKGPVRLIAMTPDFPRAVVDLEVVSLPLLMFLLPILGGLCGGLAGWWRQTSERPAATADSTRDAAPRSEAAPGTPGVTSGVELSAPHARVHDVAVETHTEVRRAASGTSKGPLVPALLGILTGAVLHWAFVFDLVPAIPRAVVMNQFSWFVLPVLGGWLGAEVFDIMLRKLGVISRAVGA